MIIPISCALQKRNNLSHGLFRNRRPAGPFPQPTLRPAMVRFSTRPSPSTTVPTASTARIADLRRRFGGVARAVGSGFPQIHVPKNKYRESETKNPVRFLQGIRPEAIDAAALIWCDPARKRPELKKYADNYP